MRTETFLSEDVSWPRFVSVSSDMMRLREGCVPRLAWKFNSGPHSREWVTLDDEKGYKRMMEMGAKRIRDRAKKESNLKDPDLAHGWRIDLKVRNKVDRIEEEEEEEDTAVAKGKEKEKSTKKLGKRKRGERKKALTSLSRSESYHN
jgi:hypothetical protein